MMKRALTALLLLSFLFSATAAFAGGRKEARPAEPRDEAVRVAFVAPRLDMTEFFGQFYDAFRITLDQSGLAYTVREAAPAGAQQDIEGLDRILGDILSLAPDYLVLVISDYMAIRPRLVELQRAGINMILVDFMPDDEQEIQPVAWVLTNHFDSGYITGHAAGEWYHQNGYKHVKTVKFHGTAGGEVGIARMKGYHAGFEDAAREFGFTWELLTEVWTEFNRDLAFEVAQNIGIAHPDVNLVFAANSATGLGVMEGLRVVGMLDKVKITGIGGQLEELAAIIRGEILLSGVRLPRAQGQLGAEILIEHATRGDQADIDEVNYGLQVVVRNAEDIFKHYPREMLDWPEFRRNLPPGVWDRYMGGS